ncbi:MAG: 5-aminolevulic acid synthase [Alphaproteobacteria bacterium]|nr:5-aminolevulic acid synthase [Alphaproteobacteria bacterium]
MLCTRFAVACLTTGATLAAPALAEPMAGTAAKKLLFAPVKAEVEILPEAGLPQDMADALVMVGEGQPYYGAVAIAPEEGLMSEATVAAANFHDTGSAGVAVLAECNAKKKTASDCVLVAYIRPKGWAEAGFSLSSDATAAFKEYDMKTGALAVSLSTGAFGMADGDGAAEAALANCAAKNDKATDCALVVQN